MKWRTHQTCGIGAAFLRHLPPVGIFAAWAGSLLPDIIDQRVAGLFSVNARGRQAVFAHIHRGLSHWFVLWLLLLFVSFQSWRPLAGLCRDFSMDETLLLPVLREVVYGLGLGGFLHVALDMLTPRGVPVLPFTGLSVSVPLCRTGGPSEYVFLACLCLFCLFCWFQDFSFFRAFPRPF